MARTEKRNKSRGSAGNNRKRGNDFLEKNRDKPGVIVTDSGLQYQVIKEGEGPTPDSDANIIIHQRCWLVNGTVIEDTYKKNEPSEVKMNELIEGYKEGVQLMRKGSRFTFFIPPELAWGKKGSGIKIPPHAVLIFDVRLLDFW